MKALIENDFWAELSRAEEMIPELYSIAGECRAEAGMGNASLGLDPYAIGDAGQHELNCAERLDAWYDEARKSLGEAA